MAANASILIRADEDLKRRFEAQAKRQGLSMTFLLRSFMETYAETPEILRVGFDEEIVDASWKSAKTAESLGTLEKTLDARWL